MRSVLNIEVLLIVGVKIAVVMYDEQPVFES